MKNVLEISDIENGEISGNGTFQYNTKIKTAFTKTNVGGYMNIKIFIWTKDNKYKYKLGPFSVETLTANSTLGGSSSTTTSSFYITKGGYPTYGRKYGKKAQENLDEYWHDLQSQCDEQAKSLVSSLKVAMAKNTKTDW